MNFVEIEKINLIGEDERGSTFNYKINGRTDYILISRKQGTLSGNTYHKGTTKGTNPKTFVLLSGEIEFNYRHVENTEHHTLTINYPCIIRVMPLVVHSVKAITNVLMLECNSILDIQNDRVRESVILDEAMV